MHSLLSQQSRVTCCKLRDIKTHCTVFDQLQWCKIMISSPKINIVQQAKYERCGYLSLSER